MNTHGKKIAVIGGGASGMMASIAAAKAGCQVTVYEQKERIGKKILVTGNGKCNFSNRQFGIENYYCSEKPLLDKIFAQFGVEETIAFFEEAGMLIREREGYLYPFSEQASTVLDILRIQIEKYKITTVLESVIDSIIRQKDGSFELKQGKEIHSYEAVILACGSMASQKKGSTQAGYPLAQKLGHTLIPMVPALVQLQCRETYLKAVAGVRCQAKISLLRNKEILATEQGELQLTEYGISGIPVFQLSRTAAYELQNHKELLAVIDFLPQLGEQEYQKLCLTRMQELGDRTLEEFLTGIANKKINMLVIRLAEHKPGELIKNIKQEDVLMLMNLYRSFPLHINATNPMENAQVCAGGIAMNEINENMESRIIKGLFFCGEMLDVDGRCGGYNLQWAWSSGYVAGIHAAKC